MNPEHYYGVDPAWFSRRNEGWKLTRDAFAEDYNAVLPDYWSPADDALRQNWQPERLWIHPPYEKGWIVEECIKRLLVERKAPRRAVMLAPLESFLPFYKAIAKSNHLVLQLADNLAPFILAGAPSVWGHDWLPLGFLFCNIPSLER